ncbi:MAG: 3-deoxy-D-manno-octulosonic acid transferase [Deltaproteobacteria bacterium]|nr:3-deoxy-D-manno-octulosonic acid transferase [Deltaproteobacteria bacterium]
MFLLYDIGLFLAMPVLLTVFFFRGLRKGIVRRGLRERLGFYNPDRLALLKERPVIWVHAVSVGETRAAVPLLKALRKEYPQRALVLTTVTETGQATAQKIAEIDLCLYFPFDFSRVVERALDQIRPSLILIVETEIWPNLVRLARRRNIPVALVNGRLSDRSFPRYKMALWAVRVVLDQFKAFCMQSAQDAQRVEMLGAPPEKIVVTGNLKFDLQVEAAGKGEKGRFQEEFRLPAGVPLWVCGSTHEGEEEALLRVFARLKATWPELILVLVPRHPNRCRSVAEMIRSHGFSCRLRSETNPSSPLLAPGGILLIDTMGDLVKLYSLADMVFVGGSLTPVGGHNLLEASAVGKPVLFGPHMNNFKEITRLVLNAQGGVCVAGEKDLENNLDRLLRDESLRCHMGSNGYQLLEKNQGATRKTMAVVKRLLVP